MFYPNKILCWSIVLLLFGSHGSSANREYFSSIAGLEELLDTEAFLLTHLQSYVETMTSQLEMLKSEIVEIEREHAAASEGLEEYLTSPVNAYLLIKRLDKDWGIYEQTIENDAAQKSFLDALAFTRANLSFPSEEDATGSAVALVRLQETYQLDVSQVAAGILNGVKYGSPMSWQDCFQLGQQLFILRDFNHTIPWFKESLERLRYEDYFNTTEIIDFLEMVAHYHQEMGAFDTALNLTNRIIEMDPERDDAIPFKEYLEDMIAKGYGLYKEPVDENALKPYSETQEFKLYEKVCRGEIKQTPWEESLLRCTYFHGDVPYRFLMPFKMEELNLDPVVVVFHDVLSEEEIAPIKELAKPEMTRSQLSDVEQGGATAFPFLSRAVQPKKGSLMFWYNLHQSEEKDYRTKHAACPVLKGSKWIANVWIRVRGQEFRRPCGLEPDHEISVDFQHVR